MNYKFITTAAVVFTSILNAQISWSQQHQDSGDLSNLCARFPNNGKCKGIDDAVSLEDRNGEEVNCNFVFDPGILEQAGGCKLVASQKGIVVYQEQGEKSEALEGKRNTSKTEINRDRIFVANYRIWNKIHRWEIGFVPKDASEKESKTNFVVFLLKGDEAESFASSIKSLAINKPKLLREITAKSVDSSPNIDRLIETKECQYCDLSNADLRDVDLEEANLQGANLQGANLVEANLADAYLVGANLTDADLTDADLSEVNLTFANLTKSTLIDTNLIGANLQSANLQQANLEAANLSAPTFLQNANLSNAKLIDADLRGANFKEANLQQADLTGADLSMTDVQLGDNYNDFNDYTFSERLADLSDILDAEDPNAATSNKGVDFFTSFLDANLTDANLSHTDVDRVDFENANLTGVNFSESNINEDDLEELNLCGVTLADGSKSNRNCSSK